MQEQEKYPERICTHLVKFANEQHAWLTGFSKEHYQAGRLIAHRNKEDCNYKIKGFVYKFEKLPNWTLEEAADIRVVKKIMETLFPENIKSMRMDAGELTIKAATKVERHAFNTEPIDKNICTSRESFTKDQVLEYFDFYENFSAHNIIKEDFSAIHFKNIIQ